MAQLDLQPIPDTSTPQMSMAPNQPTQAANSTQNAGNAGGLDLQPINNSGLDLQPINNTTQDQGITGQDIAQHPFQSVVNTILRPAAQNLTGKTLEEQARDKSLAGGDVAPATDRPFDANVGDVQDMAFKNAVASQVADIATTPGTYAAEPLLKGAGALAGKIPVAGTTLGDIASKVQLKNPLTSQGWHDMVSQVQQLSGKSLDDQINATINEGINRGVRPSVSGKQTPVKAAQFDANATAAIKDLVSNKDKVNITDTDENPVDLNKGGVRGLMQGVQQRMSQLVDDWQTLAKQADTQEPIDHPVNVPLQRKAGDVERQIRQTPDGTYQSRMRINDEPGNVDANFGAWNKYDVSDENLNNWKTEENLNNPKPQTDSSNGGVKIDAQPYINKLNDLMGDTGEVDDNGAPVLTKEGQIFQTEHPADFNKVETIRDGLQLRGEFTPSDLLDKIQEWNADLAPKYKGGFQYGSTRAINVVRDLTSDMRSDLDEAITSSTGEEFQPLRTMWGSYKSLLKDVVNRARVAGRANPKSIWNLLDAAGNAEMFSGAFHTVTGNPLVGIPSLLKGGMMKIGKNIIEKANNPNEIVNNMLSKTDQLMTKKASIEAAAAKNGIPPIDTPYTSPEALTPEVMGGKALPPPSAKIGLNRALPSPTKAGQSSGPVINQEGDVPAGLPYKPKVGINRALPSPQDAGTSDASIISPEAQPGQVKEAPKALPKPETVYGDGFTMKNYKPQAPNMSDSDRKDLSDMLDWTSHQQPGERYSFINAEGQREFAGSPSSHAQSVQEIGPQESVHIMQKGLLNKPLTPMQTLKLNKMLKDFQTNIKPKMNAEAPVAEGIGNKDEWQYGAEPAAAIPGEPLAFYGAKGSDLDSAKAHVVYDESNDNEPLGYKAVLSNGKILSNPNSSKVGGSPYFETLEDAKKAIEDNFSGKAEGEVEGNTDNPQDKPLGPDLWSNKGSAFVGGDDNSAFNKNLKELISKQSPVAHIGNIPSDIAERRNIPSKIFIDNKAISKIEDLHKEFNVNKDLVSGINNADKMVFPENDTDKINFIKYQDNGKVTIIATRRFNGHFVVTGYEPASMSHLKNVIGRGESIDLTGRSPSSSIASTIKGQRQPERFSGVSKDLSDKNIPQNKNNASGTMGMLGPTAATGAVVGAAMGAKNAKADTLRPITVPSKEDRDRLKLPSDQYTKTEEGFRGKVYKDTMGHNTIGYGFNVDDPNIRKMIPNDVLAGKRSMNTREADIIFTRAMGKAQDDAQRFIGPKTWSSLSQGQKKALSDMSYNLGYKKLTGFSQMKLAIEDNDWKKASSELLKSHYAKQVPNRARRNSLLMQDHV